MTWRDKGLSQKEKFCGNCGIAFSTSDKIHVPCGPGAGRRAPGTQRGPRRTGQEAPWRCIGWKSKPKSAGGESRVYQRYRDNTDGVSGRFRNERRESHLCSGPWPSEWESLFGAEDGGLVYTSSQAPRNWWEQRWRPRCYSLESGGLGVETLAPVFWNAHMTDSSSHSHPVLLR